MNTRIVKIIADNPDRSTLKAVARALVAGEVCILPTDTIYGIHCRADAPEAIETINALKGRSTRKPLVVLIPSADYPAAVGMSLSPLARALMARFWPGPLTLVLPHGGAFLDEVTAQLPTVALRYPGYPILEKTLEYAGVPLVSTSVNLSGQEALLEIGDIRERFSGKVPLILDAGPLEKRLASTVVTLAETPPRVLREGAIPASFIHLDAPLP